ncbi:TadE family protein [Hamadaea tsunoensis]|uniref:TadE family protein n=1 Tax=Hamadaea tsunoensis TaxID=53368 RepID=UPI0004180CEA|nr:TadE family protein [Hamadaea tsunoensis]
MKRVRLRRVSDRGASAVEFALVAPVMLLLVFGIIDFGRLFNAQITLTEAAREGARAAAVTPGDTGRRSSAAHRRVNEVAGGTGIITVDGTSTFCSRTPGPDEDAYVATSQNFTWITPIGDLAGMFGSHGFGGTMPLHGKGVMPCRA